MIEDNHSREDVSMKPSSNSMVGYPSGGASNVLSIVFLYYIQPA